MNWSDLLSLTAGELIAPTTAAYALAAIGLNIHFGFTGSAQHGAGGLHARRRLRVRRHRAGRPGLPALRAGRGGVARSSSRSSSAYPTLKLRGDYLAIVTISAAEIVRLIGRSSVLSDITNGAAGIPASRFNKDFLGLSVLPDGQDRARAVRVRQQRR